MSVINGILVHNEPRPRGILDPAHFQTVRPVVDEAAYRAAFEAKTISGELGVGVVDRGWFICRADDLDALGDYVKTTMLEGRRREEQHARELKMEEELTAVIGADLVAEAADIKPKTRQQYTGYFRRFAKWAAEDGHQAMPYPACCVASYVLTRWGEGATMNLLAQTVTAIGVAHQEAGFRDPCANRLTRAALAWCRRQAANEPPKPKRKRRAKAPSDNSNSE